MYEIVVCPQCQRRLKLASENLGKQVSCPSCAAVFTAGVAWSQPSAPAEVETAVSTDPLHFPPQSTPLSTNPDAPSAEARRRPFDSPPFKEPPRKRKRALFLLLGLLAAACLVLCIALRDPAHKGVPFFGPDDPPAPGEFRAKFSVDQLTAQQQVDEMKAFFQRVSVLIRARDPNSIGEIIDAEPMLAAVLDRQGMRQDWQRRQTLSEVGRGIATGILRGGEHWQELEIGHVKRIPNQMELVVVTRHRDKINNAFARTRWWVGQRQGAWKIRDYENLDIGLRVSAVMSSLFERGIGNVDPVLKKEVTALRDASDALTLRQNADDAERLLVGIRVEVLPNQLAASYYMMRANIRIRQLKDQECINFCHDALRHHDDTPGVDYLLAIANSRLHQNEAALKHAQAYYEMVGDDPDACFEVGNALHGLKRWKDAAPFYRKALDQDPDHHSFASLLKCVGPDVRNDDIGARFAKMQRPGDHFATYARESWENLDPSSVEQLALVMRKLEPRHADASYYLALANAEQRRLPPATAAFRAALDFQDNLQRRQEYYAEFTRIVALHNSHLLAYADLPDPSLAFRYLAAALKQEGRQDDLDELIDVHAKNHPRDPLLLLHQADAHLLAENYDLANKAFASAVAKIDDPAVLNPFRFGRINARYRAGDVLGAYRDIEPRADTFVQLANSCWFDKKIDDLEALVEAHAKNSPNDTHLARYRWRARIHQARFDDAGAIMKVALKGQPGVAAKQLTDDFLFDMVDAKQAVQGYLQAPDPTEAFAFLVNDLAGMRNAKELQAVLEEHRKKFPREPLFPIVEGQLALDKKDWPVAAKHFAAGWNDLPADKQQRWLLPYLTARYQAGQTLAAYTDTGKRPERFRDLVRLILADKKTDLFTQLLDAHRPARHADPQFDLYEARLKILQGKPAEASALFSQGWKNVPEMQRHLALTDFLNDLRFMDKDLDGYLCVPDKLIAFQNLVWQHRNPKKVESFAKLIELHAKHHPDDPRLLAERGELHLLRNQPLEAERAFAEAKQKANALEVNVAQAGLMRARIRLGEIVKTYREFGPTPATFQALAGHCVTEKNAGQLKALLASHRENFPKAKNLLTWELETRWLNKDYQATCDMILANRHTLLVNPGTRWKCESYLVRSLIRLQQPKEALQEAETFNRRVAGPQTLLVLALASTGDVARTIAWLDAKNAPVYLIEDCYFDEDLGPILRGNAFGAFRERFPEPTRSDLRWADDGFR